MSKKNILQICVIGMPGSGKSTIGRILSEKLNYNFFDTDEKIEDITNSKIVDIFKEKGESFFRDLETQVLIDLLNINKVVISTGGGIIINNQKILKKSFNIYLHCEFGLLVERASRNKNRPLLLKDVEKNMKNIFNQRKKIYNSVADLKIDANDKINNTVDQIIDKLPS
tara:strand:+ start:174 stop:680 length:507 start_codon:yes stop_codon:yes gene_type:complete